VLVGLGVAVGAGLSLWAAKFLASSSLIYGLQPRDPATLLTAALVLSAIGGLAGWVPARRASRIDPARVLREG
jgi:ABC-type antimicrobial peptide transport system permease subunit